MKRKTIIYKKAVCILVCLLITMLTGCKITFYTKRDIRDNGQVIGEGNPAIGDRSKTDEAINSEKIAEDLGKKLVKIYDADRAVMELSLCDKQFTLCNNSDLYDYSEYFYDYFWQEADENDAADAVYVTYRSNDETRIMRFYQNGTVLYCNGEIQEYYKATPYNKNNDLFKTMRSLFDKYEFSIIHLKMEDKGYNAVQAGHAFVKEFDAYFDNITEGSCCELAVYELVDYSISNFYDDHYDMPMSADNEIIRLEGLIAAVPKQYTEFWTFTSYLFEGYESEYPLYFFSTYLQEYDGEWYCAQFLFGDEAIR